MDNNLNQSQTHLDELTRTRMVDNEFNQASLLDSITALAYILGVITGIVLASLLHKYIVHSLGW